MRQITTHAINPCNEAIHLCALDGPGPGGASHEYQMAWKGGEGQPPITSPMEQIGVNLRFQNGPVKENGEGVNGITHEALLAVLIDRLQGFQAGPYANKFNAAALANLRAALADLHARTIEREARGVEGTHKV